MMISLRAMKPFEIMVQVRFDHQFPGSVAGSLKKGSMNMLGSDFYGKAKLIRERSNKARIIAMTCCRHGKEKTAHKKLQLIA